MNTNPKTAVAFAIVTPSHLVQAEVLMNSIASNRMQTDKLVFLLGGNTEHLQFNHSFPIADAADYIEPEVLADLVSRYTPAEICWALKPIIAAKLLAHYSQVYYFDTDMLLYRDFADIADELADANILLTPHYLHEFPDDSLSPNDLTLLRGGVFNAGFFAVQQSDETQRFLAWWRSRVIRFGRNDPDNGMCGDQKWLDLVPILFEKVMICRHYGCNVAYWNMHERDLQSTENGWEVNGKPLIFVHYSGLKHEDNHHRLSIHQNRIPANSVYAVLSNEYGRKLDAASGNYANLDLQVYRYRQWWHQCVERYRSVIDFFRSPRQ